MDTVISRDNSTKIQQDISVDHMSHSLFINILASVDLSNAIYAPKIHTWLQISSLQGQGHMKSTKYQCWLLVYTHIGVIPSSCCNSYHVTQTCLLWSPSKYRLVHIWASFDHPVTIYIPWKSNLLAVDPVISRDNNTKIGLHWPSQCSFYPTIHTWLQIQSFWGQCHMKWAQYPC